MTLDAQTQAYLDQQAQSAALPWHELTPADARQYYFSQRYEGGMPEPVASMEDRAIPIHNSVIRARIYTPAGTAPFPVLVYFHGGGWVIGTIETHETTCTKLANASGAIVVSVDYRLAPEHRFPTAVEDCYAATRWVADHASSFGGDPQRLAVAGDSAGGNLAAAVTLMARDQRGPQIVLQVLIYPVTDYYDPGTPSYRENAQGYGLSRDDMIWFWHHYLHDEHERTHPYAAPLRAPDLRRLPPALILSAEYDPLRDEAELYAQRLQEAGVATRLTRYQGTIHGFFNLTNIIDQGVRAHTEVVAFLRDGFAPRHA